MSQLLNSLHTLATDPGLVVLADGVGPVPDFDPALPESVNTPIKTILAWTAGCGLALAVLGGLSGWALVAVGHNTERAALAARGKQSVLWSLIGAGGIGLTSSLVLAVYTMTSA
ncbi:MULTISPECIES: hypothetical protein [Streptomyces]|uniref:hypothetical protein n=1 Tax=Streptomyces TaxID=1883 RepID=UPI0004CD0FCC|nr:hypothetical protein [Streptomyces erythrochromogenes]